MNHYAHFCNYKATNCIQQLEHLNLSVQHNLNQAGRNNAGIMTSTHLSCRGEARSSERKRITQASSQSSPTNQPKRPLGNDLNWGMWSAYPRANVAYDTIYCLRTEYRYWQKRKVLGGFGSPVISFLFAQ